MATKWETRHEHTRTLCAKNDRQACGPCPLHEGLRRPGRIVPEWEEEHPGIKDEIGDLLQFEGSSRGWDRTPVNMDPSQLDPVEVIEDTETHVTRRCWEDMACRTGSLISPKTFREFMTPNYRKIAQFAEAHAHREGPLHPGPRPLRPLRRHLRQLPLFYGAAPRSRDDDQARGPVNP